LDEVVDRFFVLESAATHRFGLKPLIFARNYERVASFRDKITHVVMDDEDVKKPGSGGENRNHDEWSLERWQRRQVYDAFRRFVPDVTEDDVIIHGDIDELPQADFINHLKHCKPKVWKSIPFFFFPHTKSHNNNNSAIHLPRKSCSFDSTLIGFTQAKRRLTIQKSSPSKK
jgi:hypothetical protein